MNKKKLLIVGGTVVGVVLLSIVALTIAINLQAYESAGDLADALTELENVKVGAMAYKYDYGYWPQTSDDLVPEFLVGPLEATYELDTQYGWVLDTTATRGGWRGFTFRPGTPGPAGNHGTWTSP